MVLGKHQNVIAEANVGFCVENDIPVLRRISGGGTVFHDQGNINFSFFRFQPKGTFIDYDRNLNIIKGALNQLGIPAEMNIRHDLVLDGQKISGNAQHLRMGRSLHHGTLLYDADISILRKAIKRQSGDVEDKAVKSVRSTSVNIKSKFEFGSAQSFKSRLKEELLSEDMLEFELDSKPDLSALLSERYQNEQWNYGYGPAYRLSNLLSVNGNEMEFELEVGRGGKIKKVSFPNFKTSNLLFLEELEGKLHYPEVIREYLAKGNLEIDWKELF